MKRLLKEMEKKLLFYKKTQSIMLWDFYCPVNFYKTPC